MKAILINPFNETVSEADYDGNYISIYALLSHPEHPVDTFTIVNLDDSGETLFVDDEGLLNEPTHFFIWKGYPQPLAGQGLILGTDDEGETIATKLTVAEVKANVLWANNIELVGMQPFEKTVDHPVLGPDTHVIGSRPIFTRKR